MMKKLKVVSVALMFMLTLMLLPPMRADITQSNGLTEPIKNWSFEERPQGSPGVYGVLDWSSNHGGWRELKGDIDGDGLCDIDDLVILAENWQMPVPPANWKADLNGDAFVDVDDLVILGMDWEKTATRLDGSYSWYTSGGGDYLMWQWLDSDAVMALAGETVKFSFYFYPESVAPDGSQNNARAEIYYEYAGGSNTKHGAWVAPTDLDWWNAYVIESLPSTVFAVSVIIHGNPDFKAWVDLAQLTTPYYNLYYTYPPYDNLATSPQNGYCAGGLDWQVCVYADNSTGQVSAYSWDATSVGTGKYAWGLFNGNPPPGNSPALYEENDFSVGVYWEAYGHLGPGGSSYSAASIVLYLYYWHPYYMEWRHVETYVWFFINSWDYPNQDVYYLGSVSQWIPSPPSGSGSYTVAAMAQTYAVNYNGSALANFFDPPYYMFIWYIKMSD